MLLAAAALIKDASRTSFEIEGASVAGPLFKEYSQATLEAAPVAIKNLSTDTLDAVINTTGVTVVPEPAGGNGFTIERFYYTVDGEPTDIAAIGQNERIVVMLTVTADQGRDGNILVVDAIPAGYEIENPNISASGEVVNFGWLDVDRNAAHTEARIDRFVAALDRAATTRSSSASPTRCARCRRAPSPSRRRRSRTCTVRTSTRARPPARSRSSARRGRATLGHGDRRHGLTGPGAGGDIGKRTLRFRLGSDHPQFRSSPRKRGPSIHSTGGCL